MKRTFLQALIVFALAAASVESQAQSFGLPPEIASAGVTVEQWTLVRGEVRRLAAEAEVSEQALLAAADATGARFAASGQFNAFGLRQAVIDALDQQAEQIAELQSSLESLTGDADPAIADAFAQAQEALNAGHLREADRLLADISVRDFAGLQAAEAEVESLRLRAAETMASRGELASLQSAFLSAAEHFASAANTCPEYRTDLRIRYVGMEIDALVAEGLSFNDDAAAAMAVDVAERRLLPLTPRDVDLDAWARSQTTLGVTLLRQGLRNAPGALSRSEQVFLDALGAYEAEASANGAARAGIMLNLSNVYGAMGRRGAEGGMRRATAQLETALTLINQDEDPGLWNDIQFNLGASYLSLGDRASFQAAADIFEAYAEDNADDPAAFSSAQMNLGGALLALGRERSVYTLNRAAAAFEAAAEARDEQTNPAGRARALNGLGRAHAARARIGARDGFALARAAYQAALDISLGLSDAPEAARTAGNMALLMAEAGDLDGARTYAQLAHRLFMEAGEPEEAAYWLVK